MNFRLILLVLCLAFFQFGFSQDSTSFSSKDNGQSIEKELLIAAKNVTSHPNPVTTELIIEGLTLKLAYGLSVDIYDIEGKIVDSKAISVSVNTIDFSDYPSGLYFVRFSNPAIPTQRVIKN